MRCNEVVLNAIVSGGMASTVSVFLFFRQMKLKFVIYDVVPLCWPGQPLVISHFFMQTEGGIYIFLCRC